MSMHHLMSEFTTEFLHDQEVGIIRTSKTQFDNNLEVSEFEIFVTESTAPFGVYLTDLLREYEKTNGKAISLLDEISIEFNKMSLTYIIIEPSDLSEGLLHIAILPDAEEELYEGEFRCARCGYILGEEKFVSELTKNSICSPCKNDEDNMKGESPLELFKPNQTIEEIVETLD